jgi:hypothetical protein
MKHPVVRCLVLATVWGIAAMVGWAWRILGIEVTPGEESGAAREVQVTSRARTFSSREEGEVLIGESVVIRVRTAAGGYSAAERADLMARRLGELLAHGAGPADVTTGRLRGEAVVLVHRELVATADRFHADVNGTTPDQLAGMWARNIRRALREEPRTPDAGARLQPDERGRVPVEDRAPDENRWRPEERVPIEERMDNKIVPILSGGNGLRIGAARVSGPAREVGQVKAVAQLEDEYKDIARVRIWVPVSSEDVVRDIRRVDRVSVTGFADVRL